MTDVIQGGIGFGVRDVWEGWATSARFAEGMRPLLEQQQQQHHATIGRQLLGYREISYSVGPNVIVRWERTAPEQVAGLPPPVVDPARDAARAEEQARTAMDEAARTANAWLARNRPADGRAHPLMAAEAAEAATRHREAEDVATRALAELGRVAEQLGRIRAELAAIPGRIKARRQECAQQEAADLQSERDLRAQLAAFGLAE